MLADKVEIGDYVNYPVYYDNVNGSTLKGWRVISKNIDLDGNPSPGTVNLVSAGVPLTYWLDNGVVTSIENISSNFLKTPFTVNDWGTYRKNGFLPNITLTEIFSNKYTNVNDGKPQVRSMNVDDILKVIAKANNNMNNVSRDEIIKKVYNNLFYIGGDYFLATAYTSGVNNLWRINSMGYPGSATPASCLGIRPVVSLNNTVRARTVDMIEAWNIEL